MNAFVVDASVAIKWVVEETGTADALKLLRSGDLMAPELIVAECANILWKKARRNEMSAQQASLAADLLEHADIEILPTRNLLSAATALAIELDHPAYDCCYLALALDRKARFVTADERFIRKLRQEKSERLSDTLLSLKDAAK